MDRRAVIWYGWLVAVLILIGAALRIGPLTDNRLHPDEALFATLARLIVTGQDPLLKHTSLLVDKPPLFYYTLAGAVSMCWGCEITARLPGLFASVISIALVARIALTLWHSRLASAVALFLYAFSPFAISFSPTVFADPQMVAWLLAAMLALSLRRWGWGGLFFGFALATKENALFVLPLLIGVGTVQSARQTDSARLWGMRLVRFAGMLLCIVALMFLWDAIRASGSGFWNAAVKANNPGRVIRSGEVVPRLDAWWLWGSYFTGEGWLSGVLVIITAVLGVMEMRKIETPRHSAITLVLIAFICGYVGFHWIVAFPVLDRYLLPLVPITSLLIGRAAHVFGAIIPTVRARRLHIAIQLGMIGAIVIALVPSAFRAMGSGYPIGGDHGAYDGIDEAAVYLRELPDGTVIYHDTLGWSLSYYLFDSQVVPVSIGSPAGLARDLAAFGQEGMDRYLILQGWNSQVELIEAAQSEDFQAEKVFETRNRYSDISFTIYRLTADP